MSWLGPTNSQSDAKHSGLKPDEQLNNDELKGKIDGFVSQNPQSLYLIDGAKNSNRSVICRQNENGGQTCLNMEVNGISLFKAMQGFNYFCSLPAEVDATHFECRKIN